MPEIAPTALSEIVEIQQGRYLSKDEMAEEASAEFPIPVHGANGIIGWTSEPMYAEGVPLVTCRGSNSGMVLWANGPLWVSNNAMAILPRSGSNRFLFYSLLNAPPYSVVTGSAQPQITRRDLVGHKISWTSPIRQEAIASVLGALDDKIELNRRMNETLEATARAIFKDWFVDFGPTRAKMEGRAPYLAPDIWSLFPDRLDEKGKPEGWGEK
ncbi:MAG: restriction endonuclease subunit S, partial [Acetobacteraceae bacterium]